jgi:hypothetical protein
MVLAHKGLPPDPIPWRAVGPALDANLFFLSGVVSVTLL